MKELKVKFKRLGNVVLTKVVQRDEKSNTDTFEFINNRFMIECKQKTFDVINIMNIYSDNVIEKRFETPKQAKDFIKRAKECIKAYNDSIRVKEVFDIENYKGEYVMHCETEKEVNEFNKYLANTGRTWFTGDSYLTSDPYKIHKIYKSDICYEFNNNKAGGFDYYEINNYKILKFKDFTFEIKVKEDKPFPQIGDTYYAVTQCSKSSEIRLYSYVNDNYDKHNQNINNFWKTKEECKRYDKIKQKEMELSHKFTKEDYKKEDIFKYIIDTSHIEESLSVAYHINYQYSSLSFKTKEDAQAFIDFCGYEDYCKFVLGAK